MIYLFMRLIGAIKKGGKFQNPIPTDEAGFDKMIPILKEYINNKAETTPIKALGPFKTDVSIYATPPKSSLRVTWVGHSSLLIEIDGIRILTGVERQGVILIVYGAEAIFSAATGAC